MHSHKRHTMAKLTDTSLPAHTDNRDEPVTPNVERTWMASLNGAGMFTHCGEEGEM